MEKEGKSLSLILPKSELHGKRGKSRQAFLPSRAHSEEGARGEDALLVSGEKKRRRAFLRGGEETREEKREARATNHSKRGKKKSPTSLPERDE